MRLKINEKWFDEAVALEAGQEIGAGILAHEPEKSESQSEVELAKIVDVWPTLNEPLKQAVIALIESGR